jgi:hypothetical protein
MEENDTFRLLDRELAGAIVGGIFAAFAVTLILHWIGNRL